LYISLSIYVEDIFCYLIRDQMKYILQFPSYSQEINQVGPIK
jgi:hypothetical protein